MVAEGHCGIFIGGTQADALRASGAAGAISNRIHHVGPLGSGLAMKVVNNAMLQGYWVILAEVAGLAKRAGLPLETAMTLLAGGPAANGMFKARLAKILGTDPAIGFTVAAAAKDSDVFIATAESFGAEMPTLRRARDLFKNGSAGGLAEADIAALIAAAYLEA
jgi:3-hydroxyisobutyrate dehydrogenase